MWYSGDATNYLIFLATSPDGIAWTKLGQVLSYGGTYEDNGVYSPEVIKDGTTYNMWYCGRTSSGRVRIMYANSSDGVSWAKQGLALNYGNTYETDSVDSPAVMIDGAKLKMWYSGYDWAASRGRILYATTPYDASRSGWAVSFRDAGDAMNITSISVSGNGSASFIVRVYVSGAVANGDYLAITINATSQNRSSSKATAVVNITVATSEVLYDIPVVAGWNLISMPLTASSSALPDALSDIGNDTIWSRVQWYNPYTPWNLWNQYNTEWAASLNDLAAANRTMGIWIYVIIAGDGFIEVSGTVPSSTSIPLRAGWNLVGYPTMNNTTTVGDALWGTGATMVETFDAASPYATKAVGSSYVMKPGEGYWIYVPSDTVWTVNW